MNIQDYQAQAARTLPARLDQPLSEQELRIVWHAIDLSAQAGLVAELVKKGIFHRHGLDRGEIRFQMSEINKTLISLSHATGSSAFDTLPKLPELSEQDVMILWNTMGIVGEAGEIGGYVLNRFKAGQPLDQKTLGKELGDLCWYIAGLCTQMAISFIEVLRVNIQKLLKRYPNGFSALDSRQRVDIG